MKGDARPGSDAELLRTLPLIAQARNATEVERRIIKARLAGRGESLQPRGAPHYDHQLVVLVDESTQSQAEYTAMALRAAPRAKVVGSTTAGADGNVSRLSLPGGMWTFISGLGVYYPDRRPTQCVGIVPDVTVRSTVDGIRRGGDEVLEAALKLIHVPGN